MIKKFLKKKWKWTLIPLALFLITVFFLLPYLFFWINGWLNKLFNITIDVSDYLSYVTSFSTGAVAVAISIFALHVAQIAEKREQRGLKLTISKAKREVHCYINDCCDSFKCIYQRTGYWSNIPTERGSEENIDILFMHGVIGEEDRVILHKIKGFVAQANHLNGDYEKIEEVANRFFFTFYEQLEGETCSLKPEILALFTKLSREDDNRVKETK